jgi:hypothetical protein
MLTTRSLPVRALVANADFVELVGVPVAGVNPIDNNTLLVEETFNTPEQCRSLGTVASPSHH